MEIFETGIDVSRYQGNIDWQQVAAGKQFAIVRAVSSNSIGPLSVIPERKRIRSRPAFPVLLGNSLAAMERARRRTFCSSVASRAISCTSVRRDPAAYR